MKVLSKRFSFLLLGLTFNPVCFCLVSIGKELTVKICHQPRRTFLGQTITRIGSAFLIPSLTTTTAPSVSVAQEEGAVVVASTANVLYKGGTRPFAPLEALLPAVRLKASIDKVYSLSSSLSNTTDKNIQYETLEQMNQILTDMPQKLFVTESASSPPQPRNSPSAKLSQPDNTDLNAMFTRAGMMRQWSILQYQESKREKGNEMRAAFNYYTSRLEFGDSYLLTASKEERKKMIRNEQLPSLAAVITADLDLRDLHRNQFLTLIEDARAEISYQLRQPTAIAAGVELLDTTDVVNLMNQAQAACNEWFALIAPQDVEDAINVVLNE